ncbi:MAG: 3-deoxy-7-phosphoheptulonate synthase [Clostridia bacterium]|nr:3-deoxy-7-phosphoheptulonate synthase [Clostridia bacterium]
MNMHFYRKLPIPKDVKEQFPLKPELAVIREKQIEETKDILSGKSDKLMLVIGPCSADTEAPVLDYISRLRKLQDKVSDRIVIIPRVYTNKPRTTCEGYKGMLHQPDPNSAPDLLKGIVAIRSLHMKVLEETGFACADEMLYPENHRYLSDVLAYVAVGARSTENQQHRLVASGLDVPVGLKNPTGGDLSVMINSIKAAQSSHLFLYRGWEVKSEGNEYSHAVLRGYVDKHGKTHPNYHYEDLLDVYDLYAKNGLKNPGVVIDVNHSNSGKQFLEQPRISKEVIHSCRVNSDIHKLVKGLMIESYILDGAQPKGDCGVYGQSITDPCLGWEKTEKLVLELAELW